MSRVTPRRPRLYTPATYTQIQDELADAISDHVERRGLSSVEIRRRYNSIRAGHLRQIRGEDDGSEAGTDEVKNLVVPRRESVRQRPGLRMLCSLAEATGLKVSLQVEGAS